MMRRSLAVLASVVVVGSVAVATPALAAPRTPTVTSDADFTAPVVGDTLTVTPGYPGVWLYQWRRCNSSGSSCTGIPGATGTSYVVSYSNVAANSDVGKTIRVVATTTSGGKTVTGTSAPSGVVLATPVNTDPPALSVFSGTGTVAQPEDSMVLEVSTGTWISPGGEYHYQWLQCPAADSLVAACTDVGSDSNQYTVSGTTDKNLYLRAEVSTTNNGYTGTALSNVTGGVFTAAPDNTTAPALSIASGAGTLTDPEVGDVLETTDGVWDNLPSGYSGFVYQWIACTDTNAPDITLSGNCDVVADGTTDDTVGNTYTIAQTDAGLYMRVLVTAETWRGATPETSDVTGDVLSVPVLATAGEPALTKDSGSGTLAAPVWDLSTPTTLVVTNGSWNFDADTYARQWLRCDAADTVSASCTPIAGEDGLTYTVDEADAGKFIRVQVTATNEIGDSDPADSNTSGEVLSVPINTVPPALSISGSALAGGSPAVGQLLTASPGSWVSPPANSTGYAYQWLRCLDQDPVVIDTNCITVSDTSGDSLANTYKAVNEDVGSYIRVQVTATNAQGAGEVADSDVSGIVIAPLTNVTVPKISGTLALGSTLYSGQGTWSGTPDSYSYQWWLCSNGAIGSACTPVTGLVTKTADNTANQYVVTAAAYGSRIQVSVVVTVNGVASAPVYSKPTNLFKAPRA